jgi:hypothetical protein
MSALFIPVSLEQMHIISDYLYALYMAKVVNRSPGTAAAAAVLAPSNIPLSLMAECEQLSTVLADAYCNPSRSTSIVYSFRSLIGYLFKLMCHGPLENTTTCCRRGQMASTAPLKIKWNACFHLCSPHPTQLCRRHAACPMLQWQSFIGICLMR